MLTYSWTASIATHENEKCMLVFLHKMCNNLLYTTYSKHVKGILHCNSYVYSIYCIIYISCYYGKCGISLWVIRYIPLFELAVRHLGINWLINCSLSHLIYRQDKLELVREVFGWDGIYISWYIPLSSVVCEYCMNDRSRGARPAWYIARTLNYDFTNTVYY